MIRICLIDDDKNYINVITDMFEGKGLGIDIITNFSKTPFEDMDNYDIIFVDHTLQIGNSIELINKISEYSNADFALISTYRPDLYSKENIENKKISGIFCKYAWEKIFDWIEFSNKKKDVFSLAR